MSRVEIEGLEKAFGTQRIIPKLSLTIEEGEFVALVGPSGCGKSTTLRMIAGLEDPDSGTIRIGGRDVTALSSVERGVAMVFQNYALYPHMTVAENLDFALKMARVSPADIRRRVAETAGILGLAELLERKPSQLSGGQKQRVAMGRAMIRQPKVLLFDEPLSNLDAQLRVRMRAEIAALHRRLRSTVVYVTHDQVEAMTLADRIAVLNNGNLEQYDTPQEIYRRPRSRFVASFIGTPPMNLVPLRSSLPGLLRATTVGFRPEAARLTRKGEPDPALVPIGSGNVQWLERLGSLAYVHVRLGEATVIVESREDPSPAVDSEVAIQVPPNEVFLFDEAGTALELTDRPRSLRIDASLESAATEPGSGARSGEHLR